MDDLVLLAVTKRLLSEVRELVLLTEAVLESLEEAIDPAEEDG